jgi:hypothetical protein
MCIVQIIQNLRDSEASTRPNIKDMDYKKTGKHHLKLTKMLVKMMSREEEVESLALMPILCDSYMPQLPATVSSLAKHLGHS